MNDYPVAMKRQMVRFYTSLNERDRRRYAANQLPRPKGRGMKLAL